MTTQFTVIDHDNDNEQSFEDRSEAEEAADTAREFGSDNVEIVIDHEDAADDESSGMEQAKPVPDTNGDVAPDFADGMPIDSDPLTVLPDWMKTQVEYSDRGDATTTVNKRGCQVIAEYLGLDVQPEAEVQAHETEFEYATYRAVARKRDGREFTAHGTARADGNDQPEDAGWKLDMMAETRAYKRAVKAATGGGIEAFAKEQYDGGEVSGE